MDVPLSSLVQLNQFSTGRRLFTFRRVLVGLKQIQAPALEALVQEAIAKDEATYSLELRWSQKRHVGKASAKQVKQQQAMGKVDVRMDRALTGLRDNAVALARGADEDEKELIGEVETFIDAIFPVGVAAVTAKPYAEQLVAVEAIVSRCKGDLAPLVAKLGLTVNVERIAKLAVVYGDTLKAVDDLEFGEVKAARARGQGYLLRVATKIAGTFDAPEGEDAKARGTLLGPIMQQNEAISDYIKARRSVPDVDPKTGEEESPEAPVEGTEEGKGRG